MVGIASEAGAGSVVVCTGWRAGRERVNGGIAACVADSQALVEPTRAGHAEIGRASCRDRGWITHRDGGGGEGRINREGCAASAARVVVIPSEAGAAGVGAGTG